MKVTKQQLSYLRFVVLGQMLLEVTDDLKNTSAYKQATKNLLNKLVDRIEVEAIKDFDAVYQTDPEMTTNIMRKVGQLVDKILTSDLDELVMMDSVIEKYQENKEWFKEYGSAEFLRLD